MNYIFLRYFLNILVGTGNVIYIAKTNPYGEMEKFYRYHRQGWLLKKKIHIPLQQFAEMCQSVAHTTGELQNCHQIVRCKPQCSYCYCVCTLCSFLVNFHLLICLTVWQNRVCFLKFNVFSTEQYKSSEFLHIF